MRLHSADQGRADKAAKRADDGRNDDMKTPFLERVGAAPDEQHSQRAKGVRDQRQRANVGQISDAHRFDDSRQPEAERVDAAKIGEEDESEEIDARVLDGIAKAAMRRRYGPIS